ncbi:MAG TPA: glycosyltransferase [Nocardioides sp.]|uniref:glycosyltransferase n=1 Tax=Nocardioides sp. TaxID=35761 RepID=UPI002F3F24CD
MRVLVTTNAAVDHFLPLAPTVAALVADGHDVRVGCPESFAPFVRRTGFDPWPCRETAASTPAPPAPPAEERQARLMWAVTRGWPADCRGWVDSLLEQAAAWEPHLVIVEPVEHAGRVVASALGAPLVVHGWGFALPVGVDEIAAEGIRDVYDAVSTTPSGPVLVVDMGPASVQAANAAPARRYRYRPFSVPDQPVPPAEAERRRVLVTLGTYAHADAAALMRAAADAALQAGADVLVVAGHQDRLAGDPFPSEVVVLSWVDMVAAMQSCDLVVHHGGAGTSWTALSCGTPAAVLPLAGEQFRNAQILATAGAAAVCPSRDHDGLASAITSALNEPRLAARAAAIARDNQALPDTADRVGDLVSIGNSSAVEAT